MEGWNVEQSPFLQEIRAEGQARGQILSARTSVLIVLEEVVGHKMPFDVSEYIHQQSDLTTLRRWLREVIRTTSLTEVRTVLGLPKPGRKKQL
jgi:hypothetical protein